MPNNYFQFKQFLIHQDRSAFKVGTDGVLLGAWAEVAQAGTILDIGTGTGLIALMLAQRTAGLSGFTKPRILALEIDADSSEQAGENAKSSPWSERIEVIHQSLQGYLEGFPGRFDLIVSNPPFFSDAYRPENPRRDISRHDTLLGLEELASGVKKLLAAEGRFSVILPVGESMRLQQIGRNLGLVPGRLCSVRPTVHSAIKRHLIEFQQYPVQAVQETEMAIEEGSRHQFTRAYRELTRDFYLAF